MSKAIRIIDLKQSATDTVSLVVGGEIRRAAVEPHVDAIAIQIDLPRRFVFGTWEAAAQLRPPVRSQ